MLDQVISARRLTSSMISLPQIGDTTAHSDMHQSFVALDILIVSVTDSLKAPLPPSHDKRVRRLQCCQIR